VPRNCSALPFEPPIAAGNDTLIGNTIGGAQIGISPHAILPKAVMMFYDSVPGLSIWVCRFPPGRSATNFYPRLSCSSASTIQSIPSVS